MYYFLTTPYKSTLSQNKKFSFKMIMKKKNKISEYSLSDFKTCCKTVFYGYKDRPIDQWNRIYSPEVNACIHDHVIFLIRVQSIFNGVKDSFFNKLSWKTGYLQKRSWPLTLTIYVN